MQNIIISNREINDLELILNGGFSPLNNFMNKADYESVLQSNTLSDGTVWPIPVTLSTTKAIADKIQINDEICLRNSEFYPLANLIVKEIWQPNKAEEALAIYGTNDTTHPGVSYLMDKVGDFYLSGTLQSASMPTHYDFQSLRLSPRQLKHQFTENHCQHIVGFQTRNPMHRAHVELTRRAAEKIGGHLLIHPVVGMTKPGDIDYFTRVKCYQKLLERYPTNMATLSLLPLAMRMAGPREALWHAIIRKNYGCTHFIVGRDHAGPGKDKNGNPFYDPYAAQALVSAHEADIGITMIPFQEVVYVANKNAYFPINEIAQSDKIERISGTEFRERLKNNQPIPPWFSYPEIIAELKKTHPPKHQQGLTLLFTGLSGAGKSTLANALLQKLMETDSRPCTLLDGDVIRQKLSQELTFTKAHRDMNVLRIGYVASLITKSRGIAICAPIAPYDTIRQECRKMSAEYGQFIEIYVSTPLSTCEDRDTKGLYKKARKGVLKNFTGISDPYEAPTTAEVIIDTSEISVEAALEKIMHFLVKNKYINPPAITEQSQDKQVEHVE